MEVTGMEMELIEAILSANSLDSIRPWSTDFRIRVFPVN